MIKPKKLNQGDTIGIVSMATPPYRPSTLIDARKNMEKMGFKIIISEYATETKRYLAGDDRLRLDEFHSFVKNPEIKAIISTRGGYGSCRLLQSMDFDLIRSNPKIIIGYSDITSILTAVSKISGLVTFHGPMFTSDFNNPTDYSLEKFKKLLIDNDVPIEIKSFPDEDKALVFSEGESEGELIGGCLTLLSYTLGTPYEIDTKGKILFIEEIGEPPHKLDGKLTHLLNAGKLHDCAGIVLGELIDCDTSEYKPGYPMGNFHWEDIIQDRLGNLGIPIMANLSFGHGEYKSTLPIGTRARLDTLNKKLTLIEPAVS